LFGITWNDGVHYSGVSRGPMQDWAFISVESGDDTFGASVANWRPYEQEIVMANTINGEVRHLAHHRSRSPFADYYYTPRVSTAWDGSKVAWASNFGYGGSTGYGDIYITDIGAPAPPPPPPPTATTPPSTPPPPTGVPVTYTGIVNAQVTGTSNLQKTAGCDGCRDS